MVKPHIPSQPRFTDRFKEANRAHARDIAGVFRHIKGHAHMALRAKIVDFIGAQIVEQLHQLRGIGQVAIMQKKACSVDVWVRVKMVDAACVKRRCASDDAMDLIAFFQKKFGQI